MNDPRDVMLIAARDLHERDMTSCRTCYDGYGNPATWPCATALALGATGRSEWADTPQEG
jgi:hypothetical protein